MPLLLAGFTKKCVNSVSLYYFCQEEADTESKRAAGERERQLKQQLEALKSQASFRVKSMSR